MQVNIGDYIREVHGEYEGIVKTIKGNILEVEIEDGFIVPLAKNNIVVVSSREKEYFKSDNPSKNEEVTVKKPKGAKGIFLFFEKTTTNNYSAYLINNTDYSLLISASRKEGTVYHQEVNMILDSRSTYRLKEYTWSNNHKWLKWAFRYIISESTTELLPNPQMVEFSLKPKKFLSDAVQAPLLDAEGILFQIDQFVSNDNLFQEQFPNKDANVKEAASFSKNKPVEEIDLHIENLIENHTAMLPSAIFDLQLKSFEKAIDAALMANQDKLVVIHGIGNGILKREVQRRISDNKHVASFSEADQAKFGHGATQIIFKK